MSNQRNRGRKFRLDQLRVLLAGRKHVSVASRIAALHRESGKAALAPEAAYRRLQRALSGDAIDDPGTILSALGVHSAAHESYLHPKLTPAKRSLRGGSLSCEDAAYLVAAWDGNLSHWQGSYSESPIDDLEMARQRTRCESERALFALTQAHAAVKGGDECVWRYRQCGGMAHMIRLANSETSWRRAAANYTLARVYTSLSLVPGAASMIAECAQEAYRYRERITDTVAVPDNIKLLLPGIISESVNAAPESLGLEPFAREVPRPYRYLAHNALTLAFAAWNRNDLATTHAKVDEALRHIDQSGYFEDLSTPRSMNLKIVQVLANALKISWGKANGKRRIGAVREECTRVIERLQRATRQIDAPPGKIHEWVASMLAAQLTMEKCDGKKSDPDVFLSQIKATLESRGRVHAGYLVFDPIYLCSLRSDRDLVNEFRSILGLAPLDPVGVP